MPDFPDCYSERLLTAIDGRRVSYVANDVSGNWGDRLVDAGTVAWLQTHVPDWTRIPESSLTRLRIRRRGTVTLVWGSGSIGYRYPAISRRLCRILRRLPGPAILAPSSAHDGGADLSRFEHVFARDWISAALLANSHRRVQLCPDLAEWATPTPTPIAHDLGLFLRRDAIAPTCLPACTRDPAECCRSLEDYLALAGSCRLVVTNRLHVALAARLQGRTVWMLPTSWHKLRAYWQTWYCHDRRVRWMERCPANLANANA